VPPVDWPESLVVELAERRCIPVLGAGLSATALSADGHGPPTWREFLTNATSVISNSATVTEVEGLIAEGRLVDASEVIGATIASSDFSRIIRREFVEPNFQPSEWHRLVQSLDAKVVVTLSYDDIYEKQCKSGAAQPAYNISRYFDSHLLNDLRSDVRFIIKAHGCTSDPTRIILTRRQYFEARRQSRSFYAILDSLFLTSTLLFVGCGFNEDPDIHLALENANIAAPCHHPHYALLSPGRPGAILDAMEHTFNVKFLRYVAGEHQEGLVALRELTEAVESRRYRAGTS
jgi:SIR2-like domain